MTRCISCYSPFACPSLCMQPSHSSSAPPVPGFPFHSPLLLQVITYSSYPQCLSSKAPVPSGTYVFLLSPVSLFIVPCSFRYLRIPPIPSVSLHSPLFLQIHTYSSYPQCLCIDVVHQIFITRCDFVWYVWWIVDTLPPLPPSVFPTFQPGSRTV